MMEEFFWAAIGVRIGWELVGAILEFTKGFIEGFIRKVMK